MTAYHLSHVRQENRFQKDLIFHWIKTGMSLEVNHVRHVPIDRQVQQVKKFVGTKMDVLFFQTYPKNPHVRLLLVPISLVIEIVQINLENRIVNVVKGQNKTELSFRRRNIHDGLMKIYYSLNIIVVAY